MTQHNHAKTVKCKNSPGVPSTPEQDLDTSWSRQFPANFLSSPTAGFVMLHVTPLSNLREQFHPCNHFLEVFHFLRVSYFSI